MNNPHIVIVLFALGFSIQAFSLVSVAGDEPTKPTTVPSDKEEMAKAAFAVWCQDLMSAASQPPDDAECRLTVHDSGPNPVDVIRTQYRVNDLTVTITQTLCLYSVKVAGIKEQPSVDDIQKVAAELLKDGDRLALVADEHDGALRSGRVAGDQKGGSMALRSLRFIVRPSVVIFYGLKHQDSPSSLRLGWGKSFNKFWFARPNLKTERPDEDEAEDRVRAILTE
jgi:hypothetical protein